VVADDHSLVIQVRHLRQGYGSAVTFQFQSEKGRLVFNAAGDDGPIFGPTFIVIGLGRVMPRAERASGISSAHQRIILVQDSATAQVACPPLPFHYISIQPILDSQAGHPGEVGQESAVVHPPQITGFLNLRRDGFIPCHAALRSLRNKP